MSFNINKLENPDIKIHNNLLKLFSTNINIIYVLIGKNALFKYIFELMIILHDFIVLA